MISYFQGKIIYRLNLMIFMRLSVDERRIKSDFLLFEIWFEKIFSTTHFKTLKQMLFFLLPNITDAMVEFDPLMLHTFWSFMSNENTFLYNGYEYKKSLTTSYLSLATLGWIAVLERYLHWKQTIAHTLQSGHWQWEKIYLYTLYYNDNYITCTAN